MLPFCFFLSHPTGLGHDMAIGRVLLMYPHLKSSKNMGPQNRHKSGHFDRIIRHHFGKNLLIQN